MRAVAWLSSAANGVMATALLIVWVYLSMSIGQHGAQQGAWVPPPTSGHHAHEQWLLTLATIIYSFEGCGAVLPLENAVKAPDTFGCVLVIAFSTFFAVYCIMGVLGALAFDYGDPLLSAGDRGSISAVIAFYYNEGVDRDVSKVLNALLAIAVAMT